MSWRVIHISVAAFLDRFFISWEIKYPKPPKYLTRYITSKTVGLLIGPKGLDH
jgi:hypothetical protein